MGFAQADVAQEHDVGFLGNKLEAEEMLDLESVDLLGPVPAELFEGLEDREAGGFDTALYGALVALVVFAFDQAAQVFDVVPVLFGGLWGQLGVVLLNEGEFEIVQMLEEEGGVEFHEVCLGS
jgi:hypothetical protein